MNSSGERQENPRDVPYGSPGYTGHVQDSSSGLVYMQARYYDPVVGRFLSIDPEGPQDGVPGSFNRYAYALNNPYRYVDPDGRWAEDTVIGVASVSIGAYSLGRNVSDGNWSAAAVDVGGLVLDGVAMALPVVPAAVGLAIQASRASSQAAQGAKSLARMSGQLRDAAKGKGNFGLGNATRSQAEELGKAWVGEGAKLASDGKTLISLDGLRQYRPPSTKPNSPHATTGVQANLERRFKPEGQWQANGHLDIVD
jgi:RHS repeat-associated protein